MEVKLYEQYIVLFSNFYESFIIRAKKSFKVKRLNFKVFEVEFSFLLLKYLIFFIRYNCIQFTVFCCVIFVSSFLKGKYCLFYIVVIGRYIISTRIQREGNLIIYQIRKRR